MMLWAYAKFQELQHQFPGIKVLTVPLRGVIFLLDTVLAAMLLCTWVLSFGIFSKLKRCLRRDDKPVPRAICFLSQEGFTVAPTRIRTYFFSRHVARLGIRTKVVAFWDDIYRFDHLPDRPIFGVERVVIALRVTHQLLADPPAAIVQQRPTYDLITTWALHWLRGTPVIFDIDDWIGDYTWFYPIRIRSVLPWCRSLASACVVSSERLEQELSPYFTRCVKIPTFVDTEVFRPRKTLRPSKEVVFGWNGTLFQEFMHDALMLMIRTFAGACDRLGHEVSVTLEIVGTGGYFDKIEEALAAKYASYPICFKGWLDPRTMAEYLDGIDVGLYSLTLADIRADSEEATFILSKSPTKVFEYMAKGIPTISTRLGEVAHFIDHGVTGFCSDEVDDLTEAFVRLATDPELRANMGSAARKQCVDHYSMDAAGAMLAGLITEVCGV